MKTRRVEPELSSVEQHAERLARERREPATSAHLLAALADLPGAAAGLLGDRRLGPDQLLAAGRGVSDAERDPLRSAVRAARGLAEQMRAPEALALHLLVALLNDRRTAAYQALAQLGVDVHRLRLAGTNLALGLLGRRPAIQAAPQPAAVAARRGVLVDATPATRARTPQRRRAQVVSPEALRERRRGAAANPPKPAAAPVPAVQSKPVAALAFDADAERRFSLPAKRFPLLSRVGTNLSLAAARGELEPLVYRDAELEQILDVLAKRQANNACVVGPAGVGKTRIVHGVAQRMALEDARAPEPRRIIELGAAALVAGTGVRGGIAQRMQALRREVAQSDGRVVLFFDEVHQLFLGDGGDELCSEFKLAISRGELPCIGATTREEYARAIESDPALNRRFSLIEVDEPSCAEALSVLVALAPKFEAHHGVRYTEQALALAVSWSVQFLPGRALPDKAISLIDWSGARAHRRGLPEVQPEQVAHVVSELAQVPVERLLASDGQRLLLLEQQLSERVVGHGDNLRAIARAVRRNAAGLGGKRPIGTFLLLGPTGVGKTETAKALAEALFGSEQALTRLDLSEYAEPHALARLIGAPPGYVGHEAGGQLTEAVRRRPYQVILLDEFEKAHPDVLTSFLAVFDEGRMTDGRGRTVDFTHTLIVLTSNLGAADLGSRQLGFARSTGVNGDYRERVLGRVRQALAPELFNRIDEALVFAPLGRDQVLEIARRMLARLCRRLEESRGVCVEFEPSAVECLLQAGGVDLSLGARPMQRTIARLVEAPLAELILEGELESGARLLVRGRAGNVVVERVRAAAAE